MMLRGTVTIGSAVKPLPAFASSLKDSAMEATPLRSHGRGHRQHRGSRPRQHRRAQAAAVDAVLCDRARPHPRSLRQYQHRQYVDQCRAEPIPSADRTDRDPARDHRPGAAGPRRPLGAAGQAARRRSPAPASISAKATIASRPSRPSAIASIAMRRTGTVSARSRSAWPMSGSTCAPAPRRGSPASIARSLRPRPLSSMTAAGAPASWSGPGNISSFARPTRPSPPSTVITCRSTWRISPRPTRRLQQLGLVTEESNQHQYRFKDIVDLDTRRVLFTIEHEVRSMQHPMYARVLVNRDPAQTGMNYRPGRDSLPWSME